MTSRFKFAYIFVVTLLVSNSLAAQTGFEDTMQATGKINVVIGVVFIILIGIFVYLFTIERKLNKVEQELKNKSE
ncbi:MAG: CcmD family protein [Luteibaculaceae bacterium]